MRKAFSFIRFSKPEQLKGDSLRRQKKLTENLCERNEWLLTHLEPLKGCSALKGKQRATGPLAEFLRLAEEGQIERGSILIVESLDRLTREQVRTAVKFLLSILDTGIDIVTTNPEYHFRADGTAENDIQDIIIAVVILSRAHEESATKSKRLREKWQEKRNQINQAEKKVTRSCPAWLKLSRDGTKFDIIPEAAEVVKRIFQLAADGYGVFRISRKLNAEKVPAIGRKAKRWYESYIIRILRNRSVLGEFQPCIRDESNRSQPVGDVVQGYYPQIISEKVFQDARQAIEERNTGMKRTGAFVPNLFSKLIKDARDGAGFLYIPAKAKSPHAHLEPIGGRNGTALSLSFRYQPIEDAFLTFLREVNPRDLLPNINKQENKVEVLEGKIADIKDRIKTLTAKMDTDKNLDFLLDKMASWKADLNDLERQLEIEKQCMANPVEYTLGEANNLVKLLRKATGEEAIDLRTKLKQRIKNLVNEIYMLVYELEVPGSRGRTKRVRAAILQVHFKTGAFRTIDIIPPLTTSLPIGAHTFSIDGLYSYGVDLRTYQNDKKRKFDRPLKCIEEIKG